MLHTNILYGLNGIGPPCSGSYLYVSYLHFVKFMLVGFQTNYDLNLQAQVFDMKLNTIRIPSEYVGSHVLLLLLLIVTNLSAEILC